MARHGLRPRRVATAYPGQRPGCAPAIWKPATDTVEVDIRHFNRVLENDIKNGQRQFGIVQIYDIILAQACTASQIGRRLSASLFK